MFLRKSGYITTGEEKMIKTTILSNARAQDERQYTDGPVTEVDYVHVEYGHFDEYMAWVTSTWVPTSLSFAHRAEALIIPSRSWLRASFTDSSI